ncbi:MAG: hypothetical protein KGD73_12330 [Candidatus Lokiarchaeota archaeon]|nr:hypothetical protein [Candidatus Lokiarchaeota archaeon]
MDCVGQILDFYNRNNAGKDVNPVDMNKVWLSKLLVKLMTSFNENRSDELNLRNCLILLVNLFSDSYGPDHYCSSGINADDLPPDEKSRFKDMLTMEFLN